MGGIGAPPNALDVEVVVSVKERPPQRLVQEGVPVAPAFLPIINVDSAGDPSAVDIPECL